MDGPFRSPRQEWGGAIFLVNPKPDTLKEREAEEPGRSLVWGRVSGMRDFGGQWRSIFGLEARVEGPGVDATRDSGNDADYDGLSTFGREAKRDSFGDGR